MATASTRPLDVIRALMRCMAGKDYHQGMQYISDDCEYTIMPLSTVNGPAGVRDVLAPFFVPTLLWRDYVDANTLM